MKIVFMGTGAFAMPVLHRLLGSRHEIVAVYTKNNQKTAKVENVYAIADCNHIQIFTPKTLKIQSEVDKFLSINADVAIVASYGLIIPEAILNGYKFGCINVHPSDLPKWRGAAPIQRSIMAGDHTTAVCIIKMDSGIDTGPLYDKRQLFLDKTKNIHQLTREYAEIGSEMLLEVLDQIEQNNYKLKLQSEVGVSYAHKIQSQEEKIDFNDAAANVHGKIMALTPSGYFIYKNLHIKAIESRIVDKISDFAPGTVVSNKLEIVCGNRKIIQITKLQRAGGKVLDIQAFLCGHNIPIGATLN
jgi:methionyl-tRNA formyltransferase